jgi:hypothetical protein
MCARASIQPASTKGSCGQSKPKKSSSSTGSKILEAVHITLQGIGLIPAAGELADGADGLIYLGKIKRSTPPCLREQ